MHRWRGDIGVSLSRDHRPCRIRHSRLRQSSLKESVRAPESADYDEWLAVSTVNLFDEVCLIHSIMEENCTAESCPIMCAGPLYEYRWTEGQRVAAPRYMKLLFAWVQAQLDDEAVFPTQFGRPFPADFRVRVQTILKRLFRVYAHIYHGHYERMEQLGFVPHLNGCFERFACFVLEHDLIPERAQLKPLEPLARKITPHAWCLYSKRQAVRRWSRLRRLARVAGSFGALMRTLYEEVHYRPGHAGAEWAREHFTAMSMATDPTSAAHDSQPLRPSVWITEHRHQRCLECAMDMPLL